MLYSGTERIVCSRIAALSDVISHEIREDKEAKDIELKEMRLVPLGDILQMMKLDVADIWHPEVYFTYVYRREREREKGRENEK